MQTTSLCHQVTKWAATGKLEGVTMHALRHTFASMLIHSGCSAKLLQVKLGHTDVTTTMNVYGHLWPEDDALAIQAVEAWSSGVLGGNGALGAK